MTPEEYKALIAQMMGDPENALALSEKLMAGINSDLEAKSKAERDVGVLSGDLSKAKSKYNELAFLRTGNLQADMAGEQKPDRWEDLALAMAEEIAGKENVYHGNAD